MSDYAARVSHTDKYRDLFDQVEAEGRATLGLDVANEGTRAPAGEYVPASLSGGLDPTTPPDSGSALAREPFRVEVVHDGYGYDGRREPTVEIVHGSSGLDQDDRDRRMDAQRALRADRQAGRLAPEVYGRGGDDILRALQDKG